MSDQTSTAIMRHRRHGVRTNCWDCRNVWDGWSDENPERMSCHYCHGTNTFHKPETVALSEVVRKLVIEPADTIGPSFVCAAWLDATEAEAEAVRRATGLKNGSDRL